MFLLIKVRSDGSGPNKEYRLYSHWADLLHHAGSDELADFDAPKDVHDEILVRSPERGFAYIVATRPDCSWSGFVESGYSS